MKSVSVAAAGMAALSVFASAVVFLSGSTFLTPSPGGTAARSEGGVKGAVQQALAKLPLAFEPNQGQTDARVNFLARGPGYTTFLTPTEAVLRLDRPGSGSVLRLEILGANPAAEPAGRQLLAGKVNYLRGGAGNSVKNIPTFSKATYSNVYPGIDLVYYGNQRNLEYDFVVKPGADSSLPRLRFDGADKVAVRPNGDLAVTVGDETIIQQRPYVYQNTRGGRKEVASGYNVNGKVVSFDIGGYDPARTLIIDPVLSYSTYAGGGGADVGFGVAVDGQGNAYLTGSTTSVNYPAKGAVPCGGTATSSLYCRHDPSGFLDAFVTKIDTNAEGAASHLWSTYLGGDNDDVGFDVAVDVSGNVYVAGSTQSFDDAATAAIEEPFPTTMNAYDSFCGTDGRCNAPPTVDPACQPIGVQACRTSPVPDAFVMKLAPGGDAALYSTYLGGSDLEQESNPAAGALGHMDIVLNGSIALIASTTASSDFPTTAGGDSTCGTAVCNGNTDAFVAALDTEGIGPDSLLYSTYLGGDGADGAKGIAIDAHGDVYVAGTTVAFHEPIPPAIDQDPTDDQPPADTPLVNNFPVTTGGPYNGGESDGFMAKFDTSELAHVSVKAKGNNLKNAVKVGAEVGSIVYSRFLGGGGIDEIWDVAVHAKRAYATGFTDSGDNPATPEADGAAPYFPTTVGAYDTTFNGQTTISGCPEPPNTGPCTNSFYNGDAFMTAVDEKGKDIAYSTFLGGIHGDVGHGIAVDSTGAAYVVGYTMCANQTPGSTQCAEPFPGGSFPTVNPIQPTMGGRFLGAQLHNSPTEGFVSKVIPAGGGELDLVWSTFHGGDNFDRAYAVAVRETAVGNEIYLTGRTGSGVSTANPPDLTLKGFPTTPNAFAPLKPSGVGNRDAYLSVIKE